MSHTTAEDTCVLTAQQASTMYQLMTQDFLLCSRAMCDALNKGSTNNTQLTEYSDKLLGLQNAFHAFDGAEIYVQCKSHEVVQWRLALRRQNTFESRALLNNLRRLLRVSAVIPKWNLTTDNCISLSVDDRVAINLALTSQWAHNVVNFALVIASISKDISGWKLNPLENDKWLKDRITDLITSRTIIQDIFGYSPVIQIYNGDLERWLHTIFEAATDVKLRNENIRLMKSLLIDLPVFLQDPECPRNYDPGKVQRVLRISYTFTIVPTNTSPIWLIRYSDASSNGQPTDP